MLEQPLNKMYPDYQKLFQRIAVLETELFHLKQLRGLDKTLRAKQNDMKGRITGRTESPVITDDWLALSSRNDATGTPLQQWTTAKSKKAGKKNGAVPPCVQLLKDSGSLSDDRESSSPSQLTMQSVEPRVRSKNDSDPEILIVGDDAVRNVKGFGKGKVLCFPTDRVSDMNERILDLVTSHPTVKNLIMHVGTADIEEKQSEILKQDFTALFTTLSCLSDIEVCISGPLPPMRGGDEHFSRLSALSKWLATTCINESMRFIDNFSFFWDRKHLFDGNQLNKQGRKLFAGNVCHMLGKGVLRSDTQEAMTGDGAAEIAVPVEGAGMEKSMATDAIVMETEDGLLSATTGADVGAATDDSAKPVPGTMPEGEEEAGPINHTATMATAVLHPADSAKQHSAGQVNAVAEEVTGPEFRVTIDLNASELQEEAIIKLILGLIWIVILHYSISKPTRRVEEDVMEEMDAITGSELDSAEPDGDIEMTEVTDSETGCDELFLYPEDAGTNQEQSGISMDMSSGEDDSFSITPIPTGSMNKLMNGGIKITKRKAPQPPKLLQKSPPSESTKGMNNLKRTGFKMTPLVKRMKLYFKKSKCVESEPKVIVQLPVPDWNPPFNDSEIDIWDVNSFIV